MQIPEYYKHAVISTTAHSSQCSKIKIQRYIVLPKLRTKLKAQMAVIDTLLI